jgi:hypothetical protein
LEFGDATLFMRGLTIFIGNSILQIYRFTASGADGFLKRVRSMANIRDIPNEHASSFSRVGTPISAKDELWA